MISLVKVRISNEDRGSGVGVKVGFGVDVGFSAVVAVGVLVGEAEAVLVDVGDGVFVGGEPVGGKMAGTTGLAAVGSNVGTASTGG